MRLGLITIFALVLASTGIAFIERFDSDSFTPERNIASTLKMQRMMGKHLAPVTVQIDPDARIPDNDEQEMKITGYVTINTAVDGDVNYEWDLPEGVTRVSGDLKGSFTNMKPGETAAVAIYVTGFSKEDLKQIVLISKIKHGGDILGHSALISSRPEDSMEYIASDMREHVEKVHPKEFPRGRIVK
jgi:hypothetical protein